MKQEAKYSKYSKEICEEIKGELLGGLGEKSASIYTFGSNDEWMIEYLSLYYPPETVANEKDDRINNLFSRINEEPPSHFSMTLTANYLTWCNKRENINEFKKVFKVAMQIADYWLNEYHPVRSELLQVLSDYYGIQGNNGEMIKFMKDSLNLTVKFWGGQAEQVGLKEY